MKTVLDLTTSCFGALGKHRRGLIAMFLFLFIIVVLANSANAQSSSFAGSYSGRWTLKVAGWGSSPVGESEHEGTWDITVDSDGDVVGTEIDETADDRASLKGFIDEGGYIQLTLKNSEGNNTIKGTLVKRGTRLTGKLKQYCGSSTRPCAIIEIVLKRN